MAIGLYKTMSFLIVFYSKRCYIPRGRGLGGGSSHNCMNYVRGNREDYDGWAEMGAKGWSYEDVLPYFIKSENTQDPELQKSRK